MIALASSPSRRIRLRAWAIHLLTASGAVLALLMLLAVDQAQWGLLFALMALGMVIDGVDGLLARRTGVVDILPGFDGALLDNVVDYLTYAFVPAYVVIAADLVPGNLGLAVAVLIVLVSAYQFCQKDAKTADHYFKGFPSYWNIAVFYLFLGQAGGLINLAVLLVLAGLAFVPIRYLYPSRTSRFRRPTGWLTGAWALAQVGILLTFPTPPVWLLVVSAAYLVYYGALSLYLTLETRRG